MNTWKWIVVVTVGIMFVLLTLTVVAMAQTTLIWDRNPDAATYTVYAREKGQAEFKVIKSGITETALPVIPEKFNQIYEYSVRAFNECGNASDYSDTVEYSRCLSAVVGKVTNIKIVISIDGVSSGVTKP